jgi:hypothetical protein
MAHWLVLELAPWQDVLASQVAAEKAGCQGLLKLVALLKLPTLYAQTAYNAGNGEANYMRCIQTCEICSHPYTQTPSM